jgi:hypothetical protein
MGGKFMGGKNTGKTSLLLFLFFIVLNNLNGAEFFNRFNFSLNLASISSGMNYIAGAPVFELSMSLGDLFLDHKETNIGIELNIIKYSTFYFFSDTDDYIDRITFINAGTYWNVFRKNNMLLGPFLSVQYLALENIIKSAPMKFNAGGILLSAGLKLSWNPRGKLAAWALDSVGCEAGFRTVFGDHGFYLTVKISTRP